MKAPQATRAYGRVILNFGLVTVPLEVWSGTVKVGIERKMVRSVPVMEDDGQGGQRQKCVDVTKDDGTVESVPVFEDHPVGYANIDKETGEVIESSEVSKKIATEAGLVFVEDHEIERLFTLDPNTLTVKAFQPQSLLTGGHYIPKALYQVTPARAREGKKVIPAGVTKALTILLAGMRSRNAMALCELTTRGIPKPVLLMPDGTLWEVHYTEEIRERRAYDEVDISEGEVTMAASLVDALWQDEPQELTNERVALIQSFAEDKARAGLFGKPEEPEIAPVEADATDFMALMAATIEAQKASGQ